MRRYEQGLHQVYDQAYTSDTRKSPVFNEGARNALFSGLQDVTGKIALLQKIEGNKNAADESERALYRDGRKFYAAHLPRITDDIEQVHRKYAANQDQRRREGKRLLDAMPQEMQDQLFTLEAREDVLKAEAEELRKLIAEHEAEQDQNRQHKITTHGLFFDTRFSMEKNILHKVADYDVTTSPAAGDQLVLIAPGTTYHRKLVYELRALFSQALSEKGVEGFKSREEWPDASHLKEY
jgi:hypothetical protein